MSTPIEEPSQLTELSDYLAQKPREHADPKPAPGESNDDVPWSAYIPKRAKQSAALETDKPLFSEEHPTAPADDTVAEHDVIDSRIADEEKVLNTVQQALEAARQAINDSP